MSQDIMTACIGSTWKTFHELLLILTNKGISLVNHWKIFKACVRSVLLYGSETSPLSTGDDLMLKQCYDKTEALYLRSKKIDRCSLYQGCSQMEQTEAVRSFISTGRDISTEDHEF